MDPASLVLFGVTLLFIVVLFTSQRKRAQAYTSLQAQLAPGQEVVTTSGLFAHIVELADEVAVLEIGPGQRVRWDRRAISRVVVADDQRPATNPTNIES